LITESKLHISHVPQFSSKLYGEGAKYT